MLYYASRKGSRAISLGDAASSALIEDLGPAAHDGTPNGSGLYAVAVARLATGMPCVVPSRGARSAASSCRATAASPAVSSRCPAPRAATCQAARLPARGRPAVPWATVAAERGDPGEGVIRIEIRGDGLDPEGWKVAGSGWNGGSCHRGLLSRPARRRGVARTAPARCCSRAAASTEGLGACRRSACGLPIEEDRKTLAPLTGVALSQSAPLILAGSRQGGVFASRDRGARFAPAGQVEFTDRAPLPPNALYCSGAHAIEVVRENALEELSDGSSPDPRLLPEAMQAGITPGSLLETLIAVIEADLAPDEAILADLDCWFDPRRAPEGFLMLLAGWVGLERTLVGALDRSSARATTIDPRRAARTRSCRRPASPAPAARRARCLRMLAIATGAGDVAIVENPPDEHGVPTAFHMRVELPEAVRRHEALVRRVVENWKPAFVTSEIVFRPA